MDRVPIPFPRAHGASTFDPLERDIGEVDAAIELVLAGVASCVRLANLSRPEAAAAHAAAVAADQPVRVRLESGTVSVSVEAGADL